MSHLPTSYRDTYFVRLVDADGVPTKAERKVHSVTYFADASDAAEFFASELVDMKMREQRMSEDDLCLFHRATYTVEVRHPDSDQWQRFHVGVQCKLEFMATPWDSSAEK